MNSLIVWARADVLCTICRFKIQRGDKIEPRLVDPILKKFVTKNEKYTLIQDTMFLAAKRSSTPALVFCLSVCPSVSKLNFSLFGQLMTTYDSL